jgi:hypothetical protein
VLDLSSRRRKKISAGNAALLLFMASLVLVVPLLLNASARTEPTLPVGMRPSSVSLGPGTPVQDAPVANYDEQLGTTFTQSFTSLAYNVTAIAQTDSDGYGPAYLLNGLATTGYWYQVGVSYDWPYVQDNGTGGYTPGFALNYETFNSRGESIFPSDGGGGMANFTGPMNSGDIVLLRLYFSDGNVVMSADDQQTGATASVSYSAKGASSFVGETLGASNSNGFFSGLMTEWYHASPYFGNEQGTVYSNPSTTITSAWLWMDEYNPNTNQAQFSAFSPSAIDYTVPTQLQEFSSNGATEYGDTYEFITGSMPTNSLIFSFSVQGGGSGYSPPTLSYVINGTQKTVPLTSTPVQYEVDPGSQWSVSSTLQGSTSSERWMTDQQTTGTASSTETITFDYYHQYLVNFQYSVAGGGNGYGSPTVSVTQFGGPSGVQANSSAWVDAGTAYSYAAKTPGSTQSERWYLPSTNGTSSSPGAVDVTYYHQYPATVSYSLNGAAAPGPEFSYVSGGAAADVKLTLGTAAEVWADAGTQYSLTNPIAASNSQERWEAVNDVNGTISGAAQIAPTYFQQYLVNAGYSVVGGGNPGGPRFNGTSFGQPFSTTLGETATPLWLDAGSSYAISQLLPTSSSGERWIANAGLSGVVTGSASVTPQYQHEYYVAAQSSPGAGGLVSINPGWSNAGTNLELVATPASGWAFEAWQGDDQEFSNSSNIASFSATAPVNETAIFYLGLNIVAGSSASVTFSYGATAGTVPAGKASVIYVPPSSNVTLTAEPTSFAYSFDGWTGASTSTASTVVLGVNEPQTMIARSGYDYLNIGGIVVAIIILAVGITLALVRRSKNLTQ